jgi:serine/threonine protein kinase
MPNDTLLQGLHMTGRQIAAFNIARAMQFLHSCRLVHRYLKSLSVPFDAEGRVRICDFGFSRYATDTPMPRCPRTSAPPTGCPRNCFASA